MKDGKFKSVLLKLYYVVSHFRLNLFCKFSLYLYKRDKRYLDNQKRLESLRGVHNGKRAFVLGNGPSLKASDLDTLKKHGEITFSSNNIYKIFPFTEWRPTYYVQINDGIPNERLMGMMEGAEAEYKFFKPEGFLKTRNVSGNKIYLNVDGNREYLVHPRFSEDASRVLYAVATTTYALIELAVYMGCREIYIIGCDNQYSKTLTKEGNVIDNHTSNHFEGSDEIKKVIAESTWEMDIAYEYAQKYADEHGIKIYNATRGGKLEAFERVDFDSLFDVKS